MTLRVRKIENRAEWLGWRRHNVNASEAAGVMGIGKYATPLSVWHKKKGTMPEEEATDLMERGLDLEPAIVAKTARKHPDWQIEQQSDYYDMPTLRMGCTPDFFARRPDIDGLGLLQGKVVAGMSFDRDWIEDGRIIAPIDYQIQTLIEAKFTGATWAQLSVLVVGDYRYQLEEVPVPIDEGAWAKVQRSVAAFWKRFDAGGPVPSPMLRDEELVKALYPAEDGTVMDLTGDNELPGIMDEYEKVCQGLAMASETIKPLENAKEALRTKMKAKLGAASEAVGAGWKFTWKTVSKKPCTYRELRLKQLRA